MRRGERGMTLAELLVAVAMLGIVMGPLSASVIAGLRTTTSAETWMVQSRGEQLTVAHWVPDVQSADWVLPGAGSGCDERSGDAPVVGFGWGGAASRDRLVTYTVRTAGTAESLVRSACTSGSLVASTVLVPDLGGDPTLSCRPGCGAPVAVTLRVPGAGGFDATATRRAS